jgi:hypothetical protein
MIPNVAGIHSEEAYDVDRHAVDPATVMRMGDV